MNSITEDELRMGSKIIAEPVGIIRNSLISPPLLAGDDGLKLNSAYESAVDKMNETACRTSEIILQDKYADLLDGIEDYSHIVIIYWGHEISDSGRNLKKIHPAGLTEYPLKGIYSTFSPARPNPVLMSVVKLIRVNGNTLTVSGLDAIDKSPLLDIKPYVPDTFPRDGVLIPGWMRGAMQEFN